MSSKTVIKGKLAVIVDRNGQPVASAASFSQSRPGGYSVADAQKYKAKDVVTRTFFDKYCNEMNFPNVTSHFLEQFWEMAKSNGFTMHIIDVDNGEADETGA